MPVGPYAGYPGVEGNGSSGHKVSRRKHSEVVWIKDPPKVSLWALAGFIIVSLGWLAFLPWGVALHFRHEAKRYKKLQAIEPCEHYTNVCKAWLVVTLICAIINSAAVITVIVLYALGYFTSGNENYLGWP
jgi:hypothetical protein